MRRKSTRLLLTVALVINFMTSAIALQNEDWRKRPPEPISARPFNLLRVHEVKLDNGLTLAMIEDHRSPIVTIQAGVPVTIDSRGNSMALMSQVALAEATAELLTEGAGERTSERLAREVEMLGGRISSSMEDDYAKVTAAVVAENAERMIDIVSDVLLRPTFPAREVALYKTNRVENLAVERQDPAFLVGEKFNRVIFGLHPYGIAAPTPRSVRQMTRAAIVEFYKRHYAPFRAVVVVVGDFDSTKMESLVRASLGRWSEPARMMKENTNVRDPHGEHTFGGSAPAPSARRIHLIDRPGSEQSDFRIGGLAVAHSHEDYFPLLVANAVLGAGTGSRLFLNIREQKGYTYDVYSAVSARKHAGTLFGASQTRTGVTASAIKEILREFERLKRETVPVEELQDAKNYLTGLFSITLSTQGGIGDGIIGSRMLNLGASYLDTYRARVEAVTADDVARVARKYFTSEGAVIVVVGDADKLKKELLTIAPVEVFDAEGRRRR